MDLKVVLVIACLVSLAIPSINAGIPKCCIKTKRINPKKLLHVERWELQSASGACDIEAAVLYVKGQKKPLCAFPKWIGFLKKLRATRKS